LLLVLAIAVILRSESHGTHDRILLTQIRDSPNLEEQVPVFISPQEQGGPVILPGTLPRSCSLYSLGLDRIENAVSNISSIVACISVAAIIVYLAV
jgi:hypothetical protein